MKNSITLAVCTVFLLSLALVMADDPPSLNDFHQFYGKVNDLPADISVLKATIGTASFTTSITSDKQYGYYPTFKVEGANGNTITFMVVDGAGIETGVGSATYQNGGVTDLTLQYPVQPPPPPPPPPPVPSNTTSSGSSGSSSGSGSSGNVPPPAASTPQTCQQSWECGGWSLCRNNQQTRLCYRVDVCDQMNSNHSITILSIPKPAEQQACVSESSAPAMICSPSFKRCLGQLLQQCSADGIQWKTIRSCPSGCDSVSLECGEPTPAAVPKVQRPSSGWMYYLGGSLALVLITTVILVSMVRQRKYRPAKEYIARCRERGFSDGQIKSKLVESGWEVQNVDSLMKK